MNQRKLGSLISYLQMILGIVISLVYTPYMIRLLGQSEYGLYNTVASTISMLAVLSLGFNSSYIRYYSRYKQNNDEDSIKRLNGLFIIIFVFIGIIALLCGLFLCNHMELVFKDGLTNSEYVLARKLLFLLTLNLAISFPMSVFTNIISAHEMFVFLKLLGVVKTVCGPLITLPLLLAGYRSLAIVVVTVALSLFTDTVYFIYVIFELKERFWFSHFENGLFKEIFIFTSFIAINIVVDQINWNIDKLLLARYKGTIAVAIYSVGYTLNNYYMLVSNAISGVFTPLVHRIVNATAENFDAQRRQLTELMIKVGRVQFLILGLFATGLVIFGKPFIRYWAGEGYDNAYYVVLLLVLPETIPLIQNIGIEIQRAENKHKFRSISYLIMALVNLVLSIHLCQLWGVVGCAIGTAFSLVIANGLLINIYYQRACNVDVISFWKSICSMLKGFLIPIVAGIVILRFVQITSLISLALWICIHTGIYCISMWFFGMNDYEHNLVRRPLRKILDHKLH